MSLGLHNFSPRQNTGSLVYLGEYLSSLPVGHLIARNLAESARR